MKPIDEDPTVLRQKIEALSIELEALHAQVTTLKAQARYDPLTGILNRRGVTEHLVAALAQMARHNAKSALLLGDLNGFKAINDTYGHAAGDRALVHVAEFLKNRIRAFDGVGRLGGDEFALILRDVDAHQAEQKARNLEAALFRTPFVHEGCLLPLRISVGVAGLKPGDTATDVLTRADKALYARKDVTRPL